MIEARNITKRFADLTALDGISFDVQQGEVLGFLGPNGAGKTTMMRILTGYLPMTEGCVSIAGYDVLADRMEVRRCIGYLPENVPLYPEMRVREYLKFRARIKGVQARARTMWLAQVIEQCGLHKVVARPIKNLSKGYRQRVGLADALLNDPDVLILDEPTIGLDPIQIRQVRGLITKLGENRTVILSTHILPEVEMICKRFLIINEGKIAAKGTMDDLKVEKYVHVRFLKPSDKVKALLGKIPGVKKVTREGMQFILETTGDEDVAENVYHLSNKRGWVITELGREGTTLEELFISHTMRDVR